MYRNKALVFLAAAICVLLTVMCLPSFVITAGEVAGELAGELGTTTTTEVPAAAEAAETAETSWLGVLSPIISMVVKIVTPILLILGAWAAKRLGTKLGLELTAKQLQLVDKTIKHGINWVEAWAAKKEQKPSSDEKLKTCVNWVAGQLAASGLPKIAEEKLIELIEAQLKYDKNGNGST